MFKWSRKKRCFFWSGLSFESALYFTRPGHHPLWKLMAPQIRLKRVIFYAEKSISGKSPNWQKSTCVRNGGDIEKLSCSTESPLIPGTCHGHRQKLQDLLFPSLVQIYLFDKFIDPSTSWRVLYVCLFWVTLNDPESVHCVSSEVIKPDFCTTIQWTGQMNLAS